MYVYFYFEFQHRNNNAAFCCMRFSIIINYFFLLLKTEYIQFHQFICWPYIIINDSVTFTSSDESKYFL